MDKNEYNLKLEEIDRYVNQGNYSEAAKVADTVDWRRVRNVRTLCMISEIYEADNRYEDSKVLLLRAYRRSPVGRAILYRLVEVTIQLKQFDEAIEYYSEYVQAAPHDNNKYILKYKIYRGRGSSLEEQIDILKEYLSQEYSEKWAYELARLYQQADQISECLAACDDLVLWFHSGKYVIKALELKRRYAPLTPKQQEIYDHRFEQQDEDEEDYVEETKLGAEKQIVETNEDALAESIMADVEREIAQSVAETKQQAREEIPETEAEKDENAFDEPVEDAQVFDEQLNKYNTQDLQTEMVKSMREIVSGVARRGNDEEKDPEDQVIEQSKVEQEAAREQEISLQMPPRMEMPGNQQKPSAGKLSIDNILLSMGERGEAVREAAAASKAVTREDTNIMEGMPEFLKRDRGALRKNIEESVAVTAGGDMTDAPAQGRKQPEDVSGAPAQGRKQPEDVFGAPAQGRKQPEDVSGAPAQGRKQPEDVSGAPVQSTRTAEEAASSERTENPETGAFQQEQDTLQEAEPVRESRTARRRRHAKERKAAQQQAAQEAATVTEQDPAADREISAEAETADRSAETIDIATAKTRRIPTDEIAEIHASYGLDQDGRRINPAAERTMPEDGAASRGDATGAAPSYGVNQEVRTGRETEYGMPGASKMPGTPAQGPAMAPGTPRQSPAAASGTPAQGPAATSQMASARGAAPSMTEVPPQQTNIYGTRPVLKEYHKGMFAGFIGIQNMEEQIAMAITRAEQKGEDKTSRTGNILIFGGHGCGKTTIATSIAKAIAQDRGSQFVKMAKIYASDFNRKDIAATIAKIAGGTLIIEEAGDLEDAVVDQLTTAMEFRTDGLIIILEDEQRYIHDLLMRHPRFTMKFTSQIFIPVFTIDELVRFGELYAADQDYVFSEAAAAALYDRIDGVAAQGDAVSITNVIELVDRAIHKSNKFFRKLGAGKKRYDENNCIILQEKDFR